MPFNKAVRRAIILNKMVPRNSLVYYAARGSTEYPNDAVVVQYYGQNPVGIAAY